ncbi:MAG: hypothetical protein KAR03_08050 [Candidatus Thorarchaeota archaeon]|nr:hypothetical protein [Candidatus Thorarchaeota archaeon]
MEREKMMMLVGIILVIVGIIGILLPVGAILNLHRVEEYLVLIDPSDTWPYDPDNTLVYEYLHGLFLRQFLEIAPFSCLLMSVGLVGIWIRYRSHIAIVCIGVFLLSAQQTSYALGVFQERPWPVSLEYWEQMIPPINNAFLSIFTAYLVLGIVIMVTRTSRGRMFERSVVIMGAIVSALSALSITRFFITDDHRWITQSVGPILATTGLVAFILIYFSVPSTMKKRSEIQKVSPKKAVSPVSAEGPVTSVLEERPRPTRLKCNSCSYSFRLKDEDVDSGTCPSCGKHVFF